jgi:hypothetical protein
MCRISCLFLMITSLVVGVATCSPFHGDESSADAGPEIKPDGSGTVPDSSIDASVRPVTVVRDIPTPRAVAVSAGTLAVVDASPDAHTCSVADCQATWRKLTAPANSVGKAGVALAGDLVGAFAEQCISDGVVWALSSTQPFAPDLTCPRAVVGFGGALYFAAEGVASTGSGWSVQRCVAAGCTTIATGSTRPPFGAPTALAVTPGRVLVGTDLYAIVAFDDVADAGTPTNIAQTTVAAVASDGISLFWFDGAAVNECTTSDCNSSKRVVSRDATVRALVADASGLYWTSAGSGDTDGKVFRRAPGAPTPVALASGLSAPIGLALDDTSAYWASDGCGGCSAGHGEILRVAKAGP